jgi:hypothetical protein
MRIYKDGIPEIIFLDDYFVCSGSTNNLAFLKCSSNDVWMLFLEKIWAKLCGSYMNINYGYSIDVIKDFTGAPSKTYRTSTEKDIWARLNKHKDSIIICTS